MDAVTSRRIQCVVVLFVLILSGLAVLPSSTAQISLGNREGQYDYGWTFPTGDFPGGEATDPEGDVAFGNDPSVPIGLGPTHSALDLVRLRIDEPDREVLRLQLDVAGLDARQFLAENLLFGAYYTVWFTMAGQDHRISMNLWVACKEDAADPCEPYTDPTLVVRSTLYRMGGDSTTTVGLLPSRVLVEEDRMELLIPRWALAGDGRAAPARGDPITDVSVSAGTVGTVCTNNECLGSIHDRLPDEGSIDTIHTVTLDSDGAHVRIQSGAATGGAVTATGPQPLKPRTILADVDGGAQVRFPVTILNHLDRKALIQPQISVVSGGSPSVSTVEVLEVPSKDERRLQIRIDPASEWSLDDPLVLRLEVTALGTEPPARDVAFIHVRTVPSLSADEPRLYLHTYGGDLFGLSEYGVQTFQIADGILNTLADDPLDNGKGHRMHDLCLCFNAVWQGWVTQAGLARPLHLDNETGATMHLGLEVPVAGALDVHLVLSYGDEVIAVGQRAAVIETGDDVSFVVPLHIDDEATLIEPVDGGFHLSLRASFRPHDVVLAELVGIVEPVNPRMKTQGATWIELPIVDPAEAAINADHLVLQRAQGSERVQYLNPGKNALWNISVTNQASEADHVTFSADVPGSWKVRFLPGTAFRLGPGESVTVGLLVTAPGDAAEATTAAITLKAASRLAEGNSSSLGLSAVVTTGVAIESAAFVADNATRERMEVSVDGKESPGVATLPFLFLGLVIALWGRRSRR